jgi:hypothetical protein
MNQVHLFELEWDEEVVLQELVHGLESILWISFNHTFRHKTFNVKQEQAFALWLSEQSLYNAFNNVKL